MVDRFNAFADLEAFEFEVWFNDRIHPDRRWEVSEETWRFRYRYLPRTHFFGRTQHWPLLILGRRPDVLISQYSEPAFIAGWVIAKLRGTKTGFRVLKTFDRWVSRHPLKDKVKRFMFSHADAIETPGEEGKQFAIHYGASTERIHFATHTVDIPYLEAAVALMRPQRDSIRQSLGLEGTTFLYVGRLWWGKGITYLLDAFEIVQRRSVEPVSLLIVGDGPQETSLKQACAERGIHNVVFAGFQQKSELAQHYVLADVFVFPTLGDPYGLVVDEAMACGLPVISTSAAGEIHDRIEEGSNGYIVPPEDSAALAGPMLHLARNPDLVARLGCVSKERIQGKTPQKWAEEFQQITLCMLDMSPA